MSVTTEELSQSLLELNDTLDIIWRAIAATIVFSMQVGFVLLETGSVRTQSAASVIFKNVGDFCLVVLTFYLLGYGIAYGEGNAFIGTYDSVNTGIEAWPVNAEDLSFFFYNVAFACTAVTIVSGCVVERTKTLAYLHFTFWFSIIVYPICAHWAWTKNGFLNNIVDGVDFLDFAGSGVVHMVGGIAGLVGAILVGHRNGFIEPHTGLPQVIPGHSLALSTTGTLLLWFGWFPFNAGGQNVSQGGIFTISLILTNTLISASAAGCTSIIIKVFALFGGNRRFDVAHLSNSILCGLVSITASCNEVEPWAAIVCGIFASVIYEFGSRLIFYLKIDDPLNACTIHGLGGAFGLIFGGIFSREKGVITGQFALLGIQIVGLICLALWSAVFSFLIFYIIIKTTGLRISYEAENMGLDHAEYSTAAYPEWEKNIQESDPDTDLRTLLETDRSPKLLAFKIFLEKMGGPWSNCLDFLIAVAPPPGENDFLSTHEYHLCLFNRYISPSDLNDGEDCTIPISPSLAENLRLMLATPSIRMFQPAYEEIIHALACGPFSVFTSDTSSQIDLLPRRTTDGPYDVVCIVQSDASIKWRSNDGLFKTHSDTGVSSIEIMNNDDAQIFFNESNDDTFPNENFDIKSASKYNWLNIDLKKLDSPHMPAQDLPSYAKQLQKDIEEMKNQLIELSEKETEDRPKEVRARLFTLEKDIQIINHTQNESLEKQKQFEEVHDRHLKEQLKEVAVPEQITTELTLKVQAAAVSASKALQYQITATQAQKKAEDLFKKMEALSHKLDQQQQQQQQQLQQKSSFNGRNSLYGSKRKASEKKMSVESLKNTKNGQSSSASLVRVPSKFIVHRRDPVKMKPSFFSTKEPGWTRFVVISDTHAMNKGVAIPKGDVLIHCGDFTNVGELADVKAFAEMIGRQPHQHKIVIAGNHDLILDKDNYPTLWRKFGHAKPGNCVEARKMITDVCTYLEDEMAIVEGYSIYGSPWTPEFQGWAFNLPRGEKIKEKWQKVPVGVDILITHGPPAGHGDLSSTKQSIGCEDLYDEVVNRIKPRVHAFGHVHSGYGCTEESGIHFVNASICNDTYKPIQHAIIFDMPPIK